MSLFPAQSAAIRMGVARPRSPADGRAARPYLARLWLARAALVFAFVIGAGANARAAEVIPASPPNHFNDFVHVVPAATAQQLDRELAQFERDTSNQIVVAIYPHMQSDSSLDDYATRVYQAWHIGQKGRDNGALLLVFTQDHRMRIQTGYGLEGALPDVLCKRIMDDEISPRLRAGDFGGGIAAGVHAILAATRGEYHGTGRTVRESQSSGGGGRIAMIPVVVLVPLIFVFIIVVSVIRALSVGRSMIYGRRGRSTWMDSPWWLGGGGGGGSSSGGGWGGGGGWSGGGGGFSGGGGGTGGGGASGSW